jgi:hypothetical protein
MLNDARYETFINDSILKMAPKIDTLRKSREIHPPLITPMLHF